MQPFDYIPREYLMSMIFEEKSKNRTANDNWNCMLDRRRIKTSQKKLPRNGAIVPRSTSMPETRPVMFVVTVTGTSQAPDAHPDLSQANDGDLHRQSRQEDLL